MRLSRIIMLPFALFAGYIAYEMVINYRYELSWYLAFPIVILAAVFSLHPQIDAWGYKRWKPKTDAKLRRILEVSSPSFAWIREEDRDDFISDLLLHCRKMEFIGKEVEDIPTDVQIMTIYPGKLLEYVFGLDLLTHFNRVVVYKHPFPSPRYRAWHAAEAHEEDGVMIFSLEQLLLNYVHPGKEYHVGFDAWIRAAVSRGLPYPEYKEDLPETIFSLDRARKYLGLQHIPPKIQHIYAYLLHKEAYLLEVGDGHSFFEEKKVRRS